MTSITELGAEIAVLWRRESELEEQALREGDPILRTNFTTEAAEFATERRALHEDIARLVPTNPKETLILALIAADYFAVIDAGNIGRDTPLRNLHSGIIGGLEDAAGMTRKELGLAFLWDTHYDGPGT